MGRPLTEDEEDKWGHMYILSSAKLVGVTSSERWSQAHVFDPSGKKQASRGTLLLVLSLHAVRQPDEAAVDLSAFGKEILTRFHELYYGSETGESILDHLRKVVELVVGEFAVVEVELLAAVMLPIQLPGKLGVSYICGSGSGSVLVLRDERLYRVLETRGEGAERAAATASGFITDGDFFLLATGAFFQLVSPGKIKQALIAADPAESGAILAPQVHGGEDASGVAVVLARFGKPSEAQGVEEEVSLEPPDEGVEEVGIPSRLADRWRKGIERLGGRLSRMFSKNAREELKHPDAIVVRGEDEKRRRLMYSVALVLLVLLVVSVILGWRRRTQEEKRKVFTQSWEVVDHQYREAVELVTLNPLRTRALLVEAKKSLEEVLALPEQTFLAADRKRLEERSEEISRLLEEVSGEHRISEAQLYLDLELVRPGTSGDVTALHGGTLVVLDRDSGVLLRVDVARKSAEAVGGGALLAGSRLSSVYAGRGFVLAEAGVVEVSLSGKTTAVVVQREAEWAEPLDLEVFGGNLYLLDRGRGEIFRYQGIEGGFGSRQRWFGEGVSPDLSGAVDMAIDGDIWILTQETILRYRQGVPEAFRLSGIDRSLANPVTLFTDEGSDRLYVLDRGNHRVLVFDKSGEYREQYIWDGIASVADMAVSEEEGKILLLSSSVIYEIELRQ